MEKFYTYRQNNSGGRFQRDNNVDVIVVIEANNHLLANHIAEMIGIYFNGVENGTDCDCCGDRWEEVDDQLGDAKDTLTYCGTPIEELSNWVVHYLDGTIKRG